MVTKRKACLWFGVASKMTCFSDTRSAVVFLRAKGILAFLRFLDPYMRYKHWGGIGIDHGTRISAHTKRWFTTTTTAL